MMTTEESPPFFSIVIATLNSSRTLAQCLDSLASQRFTEFEVLVVDGASTDGTQAIVASYGPLVDEFVSEPDQGIYDAWNKALSRSRGQWICFLGADDYLWDSGVLADYRAFLQTAGPCRFVYGQVAKVNADGRTLGIEGQPWPLAAPGFSRSMTIPHVASLHHRSLFDKRRFDPSYRIAGDYQFLRPELLSHGAIFFPRLIAGLRTGGVSTRLDYALPAIFELRRVLAESGRVPWTWYAQLAKTSASVLWRRLSQR